MSVIVVKGRPISINSSSRSKNRWKNKVAQEARRFFSTPLDDTDLRITITFFYDSLPDFDTDNVCKPICDALKGVAYNDDSQLMERNARRRDLNGSYRIKGIDPELAVAMAEGEEFVSIKLDKVGRGVVEI